jgi:DNA-binding protein H-NS
MPSRVAVVLLCLLTTSSQAQQRPLPDQQVFFHEVRRHLDTDDERQAGYMYVETRREQKLDKAGQPTGESVKVHESYPALPGEDRWLRLLSEDGRPVPPSELDKADRDRQKHVEEYARKLAKDPAQERAKQERERERERQENAEAIDDVLRVLDVQMVGRDVIEGHDTIVLSLTPRRDAKPRTRAGKIARNFSGRAWFSESEYELVRVDLEAIDTVSFGFGLLARIHKGSHASFQRRKVNGEAWLPALASYTVSARVGRVAVMRREVTVEFANYKKFGVNSTYQVTPRDVR